MTRKGGNKDTKELNVVLPVKVHAALSIKKTQAFAAGKIPKDSWEAFLTWVSQNDVTKPRSR